MKSSRRWFLAFTAVFAVLAGFVFWGTWSVYCAPVMPDHPILHSPYELSDWWRGWLRTGRFVPGDLITLTGMPYFWQELKYVLSLYFAALGMVYFLRGKGLERIACYGAGLFLAFSGYWCSLFSAGHYGWFQWMTYGVFAFGLVDRAIAKGKPRHWLLLGATVAWGSFNQPDLWLIFTVTTGVYFLYRTLGACRLDEFSWKRYGIGVLMAAITLFAIGAPSFRHAICSDLKGRDQQIADGQTLDASVNMADMAEKRWIFVTNWSLPTSESLEFVMPRVNGDTSCPITLSIGAQKGSGVRQYTGALGRPKDASVGNYRQHSLYVGFVTCLLALLGLSSVRCSCHRGDVLFFAVAAVVFWLFSQGRYCESVYRMVFALPFGDYLRAPVKWHHLTEFCLVVLAGFGIDAIVRKFAVDAKSYRRVMIVAAVVVILGAFDLARVDKLFCAPVDIREARRQNCNQQMTFLRRSDFNNPNVAAMVKAKRIVPLANPSTDVYLVGVLDPWVKNTDPIESVPMSICLGIVSLISTIAVSVYGVRKS